MPAKVSRLHELTDEGIRFFRQQLEFLRTGDSASLPSELLSDPVYAAPVKSRVELTRMRFDSKLDFCLYITTYLDFKRSPELLYSAGLWSWLAVFYFDQVCPIDNNQKPRADYRYILADARDWRHYYRHLLAGPARVYHLHDVHARLLLSGPLHQQGDFFEQLASRQEIVTNRGAIQAAGLLYWDSVSERPKRGAAATEKKPGTLRRFTDVYYQFDMTYDMHSMDGKHIASLLPAEFAPWLQPRTGAS